MLTLMLCHLLASELVIFDGFKMCVICVDEKYVLNILHISSSTHLESMKLIGPALT